MWPSELSSGGDSAPLASVLYGLRLISARKKSILSGSISYILKDRACPFAGRYTLSFPKELVLTQ